MYLTGSFIMAYICRQKVPNHGKRLLKVAFHSADDILCVLRPRLRSLLRWGRFGHVFYLEPHSDCFFDFMLNNR